MSQADREKWETKYREGAYSERPHPSVFLVESIRQVTAGGGRALDLACGAGRNALYLAEQGFQVDAVDIAREGLLRATQSANRKGLQTIDWHQHDLDLPLSATLTGYQLIIMVRYLAIDLLQSLIPRLQTGGFLLAEVHLQTDEDVAGPGSQRFRAAPGALKAAASALETLEYSEGFFTDPDGARVALARLLARKP